MPTETEFVVPSEFFSPDFFDRCSRNATEEETKQSISLLTSAILYLAKILMLIEHNDLYVITTDGKEGIALSRLDDVARLSLAPEPPAGHA